MRTVLKYAALAVAGLGIAGCTLTHANTLGKGAANGSITKISALTASTTPLTIEGTMIDKCPVAGCWFHVKDSTGVIRVDTKSSGFVVAQVPINSHVIVTGIVRADDTSTLSASGMTYQ